MATISVTSTSLRTSYPSGATLLSVRVVVNEHVGVAAREQTRRRLWVSLFGALIGSLLVLQLRYVGRRGRGPQSWEFIGVLAGLCALAIFLWWLATRSSRRTRLLAAVTAAGADAWVAVIHAQPNDLRALATPVPPADWATRRFWGSDTDYGKSQLPAVLVLRSDSLILRFPTTWSHVPDLDADLSEVDEVRLSVDDDGRPCHIALVLNEHDLAYRLREPIPNEPPEWAIRASDRPDLDRDR